MAAEDSIAYGGGAGGKFRKKPSRRPQATPYDRPLTALRSFRRNDDENTINGGWLSRIVDPASNLISATAHKFFSSVFRKRLLPPPRSQASPVLLDEEAQPSENHLRSVISEDPSRVRERDVYEGNSQLNGSVTNGNGVVELEHMLKQKTFTRSEIDRLSALLLARSVDKTGISGKREFEVVKSPVLSSGHSSQAELKVNANENGFNPSQVPGTDLTPAFRSKVSDDHIASPAELAKAYMGSRSTKAPRSMSGSRNQAAREETPAFSPFQLHGPTVSALQNKPLSTAETSQNGFAIAKSHGRSAIYSMARTPYFRVKPSATKVSGTGNDAFDGSLPSQKVLKRRCSVLENDIGSVGPIRRIRQKSNLLYPKTLGLPYIHTTLTDATTSKASVASVYSSKSPEDRGDKRLPVSNSHVSSESMEAGKKILQVLEKMTPPPKEKSSGRESRASGGVSTLELTPAMLHGHAHKGKDSVGSHKFLHSDQVNNQKVDPHAVACEVQVSTPKKQGTTVHDSSSKVFLVPPYKVYSESGIKISTNDVRVIAKPTGPIISNSADDVLKKREGFQISAHEDHLELDDAHSNGVINEDSSMYSNGNMRLQNPSLSEAENADKPAFSDIQPTSNSVLKKNIDADYSNLAEKGIGQSFATSDLKKTNGFSVASFQPAIGSQPSLSDKLNGPPAIISFGLETSDKVTQFSFVSSSAVQSSSTEGVKSQNPSSVYPLAAGVTDAAVKSSGSYKSSEAVEILKQPDNTSLSPLPGSRSNISTTSFKMPANTSTGNINSLVSCPATSSTSSPFLFSSQSTSSGNIGVSAKEVGGDATDATATINGSNNSSTSTTVYPSSQPGLMFGNSKEKAFVSCTSSSHSATIPISSNGSVAFSSMFSQPSMPSQPTASALFVSSESSSLDIKSSVEQPISLNSVSAPFSSSSTSSMDASVSTINNKSSGLNFGASSNGCSATATPTSAFVFGSSGFSPASNTLQPSQSAFGNGSSVITLNSTSGNNNQMTAGDTMVEDAVQSPGPTTPLSTFAHPMQSSVPTTPPPGFGQTPTSNFVFGATPAAFQASNDAQNPFPLSAPTRNQFPASVGTHNPFSASSAGTHNPFSASSAGTQNPFSASTGTQNPFSVPMGTGNPFSASDSTNSGGFSLGTGGNNDKSNRRIVKVSNRRKKK